MSKMDGFGLTEKEKGTNLHEYNHALFKNMMFFMDIVWEINMLTGTVVILQDKNEPDGSVIELPYEKVFRDYMENRISESEQAVFAQYMSPEYLAKLEQEISFDVKLHLRNDSWELHRIVLTPAFDQHGELYCVYLGARNLQAEVSRELAEYHNQEQFRDALISNSYFHFTFDVTGDGLIHEDFVTRRGVPIIREITGMEPPVAFETVIRKWREKYKPWFDREQGPEIFTLEYLKQAFARNKRLIDLEVKQKPFYGGKSADFLQVVIILMQNVSDRHIHASVIWRDIGAFHREALKDNKELMQSNTKLKRTVSQEQQFRLAALSGALLIYNINLTKNQVEEEFYEMVDGKQYPMLQMMGLAAPCSFDEFSKRWSEQKVFENSRESFLRVYNREYMLDAYNRGERQLEMEFDTILGRGIKITLRTTALLVEDKANGDILAMVYSKDVTAQRKAEIKQQEALREAYEAANRASTAKTEFLARISHDIRTPMNAIIGMTAIAEKHQDNKDRVTECLKKISLSSKYLLALVDEMLDMSMIESGTMRLQEEEIDLAELFENLGIIMEMQIKERGHSFEASVLHIEHEKVLGDRRRIDQVIMNLLDNAAKYTLEDGKIRMTLEEKQTNKQDVGCYEIVVEDNGIGMEPEFMEHLFDPFVRAKDRRVEKIQGNGLGLAITNNIVKMMNGSIYVKSDPEKGTKVTVKIFLKLQEDENIIFNQPANSKVLVADGDPALCGTTCKILTRLGLQSEWASTAREALERMAKHLASAGSYSAVILDRKIFGAETVNGIREIRELVGNSTAIIVSSDSDCSDIEADARAAGANILITKPYSKARLTHLFQIITGEKEGDEKSPIQALSERDFSGHRVLMVEDNESNAYIIREILEMVGLEVVQVWNGKEALDMIAAARDWYYDIVFMDIQMPVMDGYESARAIRRLDRSYARKVPILAMSANAFAEDVQASLEAGMNEHISKPIDLRKLEESLCRWLPGEKK